MHVFAPEVLGVQVLFHARVNWDRIPALPTTRPGTRTSTPEHNQCPAMLLPQGAELFAIFIDEHYGMFVQPQGFPDTLHVLHARWGELRRLLPADSSYEMAPFLDATGSDTERSPRTRVLAVIARR